MPSQERLSKRQLLDKIYDEIKKLSPERLEMLETQIQMLEESTEKKAVSLKEAAKIMDVHVDTLRRAIRAGSINAFQVNKEGVWRIAMDEISRFLNRRNR